MSRQAILRLLDTLFRRWWLYAIPVLLLGVVGLRTASSTKDAYQTVGTINVESTTLLSSLTDLSRDPGFGWQTPAAATASAMDSLLRTDAFIDSVVDGAGLREAVDSGFMTPGQVRSSVGAYPDGSSLVKVVGRHESPDVAQRIAQATIQSFIQWAIDLDTSDSQVAVDFFVEKVPGYELQVETAQTALDEFLAANPAPDSGERPAEQVAALVRLQDAVTQAQERLARTNSDLDAAQLALEQAEIDAGQRLQQVDEPQIPTAPQPKLKQAVMTLGMFMFLGLLLGLGGVVVAMVLDHSIRFPADVKERLGTRVLAVVPKASKRRKVGFGSALAAQAPAPAGDSTFPAPFDPGAPATVDLAGFRSDAVTIPVANGHGSEVVDTIPLDEASRSELGRQNHRQRRRPPGTRPSVTIRKGS